MHECGLFGQPNLYDELSLQKELLLCVNVLLHFLYVGLETKGNKDEKTVPIAIFNGKYFSFRTSFSKIWSILKTFWCYGISLIRMDMRVRSTLKKFASIYDMQAKGQAFMTVSDMLKAMGGEELFELTQMSTKDCMLCKLGWPEKLVDELVTGALRMNYGQGVEVNAFTGFVALAGMEDGSLWSVLRGNKLLVEKALQSSGVVLHEENVSTVTRVQRNGKVSYIIHAGDDADRKAGTCSNEFDVVIIASLLSGSGIQFENFPTAIYTDAVSVPFQRTTAEFVKGTINPAFFGLTDLGSDFPQIILTTEMKVCPFQFRSVAIQIPSEITANEVEDYQKPLSEQPSRVWKIFAPNPLSDEEKMQMFSEIESQLTVDWLAYPKYEPPEKFSPFILDDGVFYINTIEKAASAMEMCAIGAKNVALLTKNHLLVNVDE